MSDIILNSKLLIDAASEGDVSEVRRLIPISDPSADTNLALRCAVDYGHHSCAELLVPVSNPMYTSSSLRNAVINEDERMIDVLYDASNPHKALKQLQQLGFYEDVWGGLAARIKADEEKQILSNTVSSNNMASSSLSKTARKI